MIDWVIFVGIVITLCLAIIGTPICMFAILALCLFIKKRVMNFWLHAWEIKQ